MSKIGYAEVSQGPEADQLTALIRTGRGWVPNIFRVLLFSPGVAEGWARLANSLRAATSIDPRTRGLVILLVAHLHDSAYEWGHHARTAGAIGIAPDQLDRLRAWPDQTGWGEDDLALLTFVAASVSGTEVPGWCFDQLVDTHGPRRLVEVAATAAYYTAVAQFARTMGLELEEPHGG
jgi:4-carboxymuconolactone decarboxylase